MNTLEAVSLLAIAYFAARQAFPRSLCRSHKPMSHTVLDLHILTEIEITVNSQPVEIHFIARLWINILLFPFPLDYVDLAIS